MAFLNENKQNNRMDRSAAIAHLFKTGRHYWIDATPPEMAYRQLILAIDPSIRTNVPSNIYTGQLATQQRSPQT